MAQRSAMTVEYLREFGNLDGYISRGLGKLKNRY